MFMFMSRDHARADDNSTVESCFRFRFCFSRFRLCFHSDNDSDSNNQRNVCFVLHTQ